jgi:DNA-binding response OmpR family regulator
MRESIDRRSAEEDLHGARVLCIDDDPDVVRALETCLRKHGAAVACAYNGRQGIWLALTEKPDIIIADIAMPLGSGGYVIECVLRNSEIQAIPVIVLSGRKDDRLMHRLLKMGVKRWLTKPTGHDELVEVIRSLLPALEVAGKSGGAA